MQMDNCTEKTASVPPTVDNCKENSFNVTNIENGKDTCHDSPGKKNKKENYNERSIFYKKPIKKNNRKLEIDFDDNSQEIRRQQLLRQQKKNRDALVDVQRGLLERIFNPENEEEEMEMEVKEKLENMEIDDKVKKKRYKVYKEYANVIMLSEWMLQVPQDFTDKWIMLPCPVGTRVLLVAYKGSTKVYSKKGLHLFTFMSALPGGNSKNSIKCTMLDCIWLKNKEAFYVLDILAWSYQEMLYCESECRFYWLKSRIEESSDLKKKKSGINEYPILLLPTFNCNQNLFECLESVAKSSIPLDGLLFYHKDAYYTNGRTPLLTWLKAYMLPEILGVDVPEPFNKKPKKYIDFQHHILNIIKDKEDKKARKKDKNEQYENSKEEEME